MCTRFCAVSDVIPGWQQSVYIWCHIQWDYRNLYYVSNEYCGTAVIITHNYLVLTILVIWSSRLPVSVPVFPMYLMNLQKYSVEIFTWYIDPLSDLLILSYMDLMQNSTIEVYKGLF